MAMEAMTAEAHVRAMQLDWAAGALTWETVGEPSPVQILEHLQ